MAVAGIFPAVAGDLESPSNSSSREDHSFGAEQVKPSAFAVVAKGTSDAIAILQQCDDRMFHENVQTEMNAMVLQGADHLQARAVSDVRQPRIAVPAKIPLQNPAVAGAIEESAPGFQFADARRSFLGMQLCHTPVVQVLPAAHGVGKVDAPAIPVIHVSHRSRYATFRHNCVGFAQQGLRNDRNLYSGGGSLDGGTQTRVSSPDDQNVVLM